jgi:pimeloyl-ACP methyl ester carboxylesterase
VEHGSRLIDDGADIVDVGGESTRPGSEPVAAEEELRRVRPVIEGLLERHPAHPISIDTRKADVAAAALEAGATIVNDVSGARDPAMFDTVREHDAAIVLMHMRGDPRTMQEAPSYQDVVAEVNEYLRERVEAAEFAGVDPERIVVDPGLGFGKDLEHNLEAAAPHRRAARARPARAGRPVEEALHRRDPGPARGRAGRGDRRRRRVGGCPRRARRARARRQADRPRGARDRRDRQGGRMSWTEMRRVRVPAGELAVVDAGDPEAPPVVLLSGGLTSSYVWRQLVPLLSPWMRVIAPDLLGAGDSESPAGADLGLAAHAESVRALLGELGVERFALVGHGRGGGVAQLVAVEGDVAALILIDSVAFDAWPSRTILDMRERLDDVDDAFMRSWFETLFERGMGRRERLSDADLAEFRRPFEGPDGIERFVRVATDLDGEGLVGIEPRLAELEIPALVLWGRRTRSFPPSLPNGWARRSRAPPWRCCRAAATSCWRTRPRPLRRWCSSGSAPSTSGSPTRTRRARSRSRSAGAPPRTTDGDLAAVPDRHHVFGTARREPGREGPAAGLRRRPRRRGRDGRRRVEADGRLPNGHRTVRTTVGEESFDLLESLANAVANAVLALDGVAKVAAIVHKPAAARSNDVQGVAAGATVER